MREPEKWTLAEVHDKMEWEGGWLALYDWGGPDSFVTDHERFNRLWFEFCDHMQMLRPVMDEMSDIAENG